MNTFIYELGVIDKDGLKHSVKFKQGLNVITGKSSTGKSAVIEIFDYCFGSKEDTIPKGVITKKASIYYVCMNINSQVIVIGRDPENAGKAFYKKETIYDTQILKRDYFDITHYISLDDFKKHLRSHFIDIEDVDVSLNAREYRKNNMRASTPSIRSFTSFILQHQNLLANKHALFYRFDEKAKRDQVMDHTKIFIGLVDQEYFLLSQEEERLMDQEKIIMSRIDRKRKIVENQKEQIEPLLLSLYAEMGFEDQPVNIKTVLRHPQDARNIIAEKINPNLANPVSSALVQHQTELENELSIQTANLRSLQKKAYSISKSLKQESVFENSFSTINSIESAHVGTSVCPFCHSENLDLQQDAKHFSDAVTKLSNDLKSSIVLKAKLSSALANTNRDIDTIKIEISKINSQLSEIIKSQNDLGEKRNLIETVMAKKIKLDLLLESLAIPTDEEDVKELLEIQNKLKGNRLKLSKYDYKSGLLNASQKINEYMSEIGQKFDFEDGYKPIRLHFSFETFDLYHEDQEGNKIYLRSMGSGANWLYSHITLFLALHKYFAELGNKCAIPSILFLDQPTQVYFPSFEFDKEESFSKEKLEKIEQRDENQRLIDEDIKAVENLFSQLSIFCTSVGKTTGITPQLIVTDHADNLSLSDNSKFEDHVNGNRWRTRGLINPI
jgi:thiol-disulfide isomerase/thioredoxin